MRQSFLKPPSGLARITGNIRAFFCGLLLFLSLVFCNCLQIISLLVYPFSRTLFRSINCGMAARWWGGCVRASERLNGIKRVRAGDDSPRQENALVIANHESMPDTVALLSVGLEAGCLNRMKWFAKDTLRYIPGLGWGLTFLDTLFLKRHWEQDRIHIEKTFGKFIREKIPVWLCFFPEGTRLTLEKFEQSRAYAVKAGLKLPNAVLIPRTKGFIAAARALAPTISAVYDVTIAYPDGIPSLWQWMAAWPNSYHVYVRRFAVQELPADDEGLARWLIKRYEEKDALLTYFYDHGEFPK